MIPTNGSQLRPRRRVYGWIFRSFAADLGDAKAFLSDSRRVAASFHKVVYGRATGEPAVPRHIGPRSNSLTMAFRVPLQSEAPAPQLHVCAIVGGL
jgi:hypothetical protein